MTKLQTDLQVLERMAEGLAEYVQGEALFGPTGGRTPKLTLGGYLMRHYRLTHLHHLLGVEEQVRLEKAISQGEAVLASHIVRSEARATAECHARLRQWEAVIQDADPHKRERLAGYATAVEPRAMLTQLIHFLQQPPYQLERTIPERLTQLDRRLRVIWEDGDFVWPAAWQPAYPTAEYWWLYGQPKRLDE